MPVLKIKQTLSYKFLLWMFACLIIFERSQHIIHKTYYD